MSPVWRKRRGFNVRGHTEHEGVAVVRDNQREVIAFRWLDPKTKKKRQADARLPVGDEVKHDRVFEYTGARIETRESARLHACKLSAWLARENAVTALRKHGDKRVVESREGKSSWDVLRQHHENALKLAGASRETIVAYGQAWRYLLGWLKADPLWPHELRKDHLRDFVRYLLDYRTSKGKALGPATVANRARHVKAVLNHGRRELECVALDLESINVGLKTPRQQHRNPVALRPDQLCAILKAAREHDSKANTNQVFPFLAFTMVSGCRRGEGFALRFDPSALGAAESWLDLTRGVVVIWGNKTSRQRILPLNTRPLLKKLLQVLVRDRAQGSDYVFGGALPLAMGAKRTMESGGRVGLNIKLDIKAIQITSGVPFRIKDCRSTLATYMANSNLGLNLYALAGELGHGVEVLQRHYTSHVYLPAEAARADHVEQLLGIGQEIESWLATHC